MRAMPDVSVTRLNIDGPPDFEVRYRARDRVVRIECKNVRGTMSGKLPWVDFQKTRAAKGDPCSRYYAASQFEILAACLHPISTNWEFRFGETRLFEPHPKCPEKLGVKVVVAGGNWSSALPELLDAVTS